MRIIVAVPHVCTVSFPLSRYLDPNCDVNTEIYGKIIKDMIPKSHGIFSKNLRSNCDNNRIICRNTPMRTRLRELMKEEPNFIVLEIHSFPNGKSWKLEFTPEIIILSLGNIQSKNQKVFEEELYLFLKEKGINIVLLEGSKVNDIQLEVRELKGFGSLIELWSSLSLEKVKLIGSLINEFLKNKYV